MCETSETTAPSFVCMRFLHKQFNNSNVDQGHNEAHANSQTKKLCARTVAKTDGHHSTVHLFKNAQHEQRIDDASGARMCREELHELHAAKMSPCIIYSALRAGLVESNGNRCTYINVKEPRVRVLHSLTLPVYLQYTEYVIYKR